MTDPLPPPMPDPREPDISTRTIQPTIEQGERVARYMRMGVDLEASVMRASLEIREKSKEAYGTDLLDARMWCLAVIFHLKKAKSGVPGKSDVQISERLGLMMAFAQGVTITEQCISEGQYIKAAAALKQDLEIHARFAGLRAGVAKYEQTPQMRLLPEPVRRFYGDLNGIAHISKPDVINLMLLKYSHGEVQGVSSTPTFIEALARSMYALHVYNCFVMAQEIIDLYHVMYGADEYLIEATHNFKIVPVLLGRAGFVTMDEPGEAETPAAKS